MSPFGASSQITSLSHLTFLPLEPWSCPELGQPQRAPHMFSPLCHQSPITTLSFRVILLHIQTCSSPPCAGPMGGSGAQVLVRTPTPRRAFLQGCKPTFIHAPR